MDKFAPVESAVNVYFFFREFKLIRYNNERTHSGKYCHGKTPTRSRWSGRSFLATTNPTDSARENLQVSGQVLAFTSFLRLAEKPL